MVAMKTFGALPVLALCLLVVGCSHLQDPAERATAIREASRSSGVCSLHQRPFESRTAYLFQGAVSFPPYVEACYQRWPNAVPIVYLQAEGPSELFPHSSVVDFCPVCEEGFVKCLRASAPRPE